MAASLRRSGEDPSRARRDRGEPARTGGGATRDRRARQAELEVATLPPVWKRSLTESGNPTKVTRTDVIAVILFFAALSAAIAYLATGASPI